MHSTGVKVRIMPLYLIGRHTWLHPVFTVFSFLRHDYGKVLCCCEIYWLLLFFQMEAKNLAIVFGPTLIRKADDNMVAMFTDMSDHCKIIESIVLHVSKSSFAFSFKFLSVLGEFLGIQLKTIIQ